MTVQTHLLANALGRRLTKVSLPSEQVLHTFLSKGSATLQHPCIPIADGYATPYLEGRNK